MKQVPRYITSIPIRNMQADQMKVSLGFGKNGTMGLYMGDAAELGQDGTYINELSFPNSGLLVYGKYSMWVSMFSRHVNMDSEDFSDE
ncbi:MAG: hypothetical protein IBX39_05210 [Candidatus Methanoperedenaceae archaeon]|nr:hypothetical protein [Candidatus Methanoperedenaceae archaeon]MDW7726214.1 hypothetical protein [Candidatus Methanoperedens sp.]